MNYFELFRESISLALTNKIILVFGLLSAVIFFIPSSTYFRENIILICVFLAIELIIIAVSMIAIAGLIYSVHQIIVSKEVSFSEGWAKGRSSFLRIFLLIILLIPFILVGTIIGYLFLTNSQESLLIWLSIYVLGIMYASLYIFGTCAIVIDDLSSIKAIWTGLLITLKNFLRLLLISGIFISLEILALGSIFVILLLIPLQLNLPDPFPFNFSSYQAVLRVPVMDWAGRLVNTVFLPWSIIAYTIAYIKFTNAHSYPTLKAKRETESELI